MIAFIRRPHTFRHWCRLFYRKALSPFVISRYRIIIRLQGNDIAVSSYRSSQLYTLWLHHYHSTMSHLHLVHRTFSNSTSCVPARCSRNVRARKYSTSPGGSSKSPHAQFYSDLVPGMVPIALIGSVVFLVRICAPPCLPFDPSCVSQ